jgi:hypothetical protein
MSNHSKRTIRKGHSTDFLFRWLNPDFVYKPISAITMQAPIQLTVTGHGIGDGNLFLVTGVKGGGSQLNGKPNRIADYLRAVVIDPDTIEVNSVNAACWAAYDSCGHIQYRTPVDLTGVTAIAQIRETLDPTSPVLAEFTSGAGDIVIEELAGLVTVRLSAASTADLGADCAYFDYKLIFPDTTEKYSELIQLDLREGATE